MPESAQWASLVAITGACAALLTLAGLPAAFFLGPMAGGVIMGINGASIRVPRVPFIGAQAIMGAFIASAISPSILHSFFEEWPIILGVVFAIIAASSFLGWLMSRWRVMPGTTSVWGSSPGAAAAMVIMAAEFGADARLVAFMQYFRVACVAGLASVVAAVWTHATGAAHPATEWFPVVHWRDFAETLLIAGLCALAGRLFRIPSGPMLPVQQEEQEWPDEVKLLLHREGPCMQEGFLARGSIEIAYLLVELPVRVKKYCRAYGPPQHLQILRHQEDNPGKGGEEKREKQSRTDAPYAAAIKISERKAARIGLVNNDPGDQEAGDHEEDVNANIPAGEFAESGMEEQDKQNCYRPEAVDVCTIDCR
jgi:membrane AbrB-like protein